MATAEELIKEATDFPEDERDVDLGIVVDAPVDVPPDDMPASASADEQPPTPTVPVDSELLTAGLAHSVETMRYSLWTVVPGVLFIVGGAFAPHPAVAFSAVAVGGVLCGVGVGAACCGEVVAKHVAVIDGTDESGTDDDNETDTDDDDAEESDINAPGSSAAAENQ